MDIKYIFLGFIILIIIAVFTFIRKFKNARKIKREIIERWGKEPKEQYNTEVMKSLSGFFRNIQNLNPGIHFIDDISWNDLDMDKIFMRLNNTQSTVGEEYLYYLLRRPLFEEKELKERERLISFFQQNTEQRIKLQYILAGLGKRKFISITDYFYCDEKMVTVNGKLYKVLAISLILSPLILIVNPYIGLFSILGLLFTNMTVYYKAKNEISMHLESLSYLVNMINCARRICGTGIDEIKEYIGILHASYKKIKSVSVKSFYNLFYTTQDPFLEYIKVVFLGELIAFESLLKAIYKHRTELMQIHECIGLIDSLISIASYRESINFYTVPQLYKCSGASPKQLEFDEIYHPLIKNPVTNSAKLDKPVLVTGSNASGKSTFLKTVAINAIFSQTIHTCLAKSYHSCYFMIFTSMALKDNIENNESYYIVEIKSLKRILDNINNTVPCLCIIDEVLRGTNTVERIAASSEVLCHLSKSNCLCIAATHDIELTSILKHYFDNYHFQESFSGNEIVFDYKLYPGKSSTRNAIKLLKIMGYNDEIVNNAEERALKFIDSGAWSEIGLTAGTG
ncbi:MAG TPA: DNA mismatch repair protein MutS [Clostridiaceae bacterium]|nr:DNA mismatch repair protein MutS [Clostridiaceae bacterium]